MVRLDIGDCTANNLQVLSTILGINVSADKINHSALGYLNDVPAGAVIWDSEFNITNLKVLKDYTGWGLELLASSIPSLKG